MNGDSPTIEDVRAAYRVLTYLMCADRVTSESYLYLNGARNRVGTHLLARTGAADR